MSAQDAGEALVFAVTARSALWGQGPVRSPRSAGSREHMHNLVRPGQRTAKTGSESEEGCSFAPEAGPGSTGVAEGERHLAGSSTGDAWASQPRPEQTAGPTEERPLRNPSVRGRPPFRLLPGDDEALSHPPICLNLV